MRFLLPANSNCCTSYLNYMYDRITTTHTQALNPTPDNSPPVIAPAEC